MKFEWLLVSRYALLVSLCELIPIPLLDGFVATQLRRRLARIQLASQGISLPGPEVRALADAEGVGCLGMLWNLVTWPFQRLLRVVLFVLLVNRIVNTFSEVVHRALLIHDAMEVGVVPGNISRVSGAMRRASAQVDTGVVDRALFSVIAASRRQLWRIFRSILPVARSEARAERLHQPAAEPEAWSPESEAMSQALADAIRVPGVQAELVRTFRQELDLTS